MRVEWKEVDMATKSAAHPHNLAMLNEEKLGEAHPAFALTLRQIIKDLSGLGWQPRIVSVRRTKEQQAEKLKKGYSKTMQSWHVKGTHRVIAEDNQSLTGINGDAADIVDNRYWWNGLAKSHDFKFWTDLGSTAKKYGCAWGGDWKKFPDVAHVEIKLIESPPATSVIV